MTSPLSSQAYPGDPTSPTTAPEGYHTPSTIAQSGGTPVSGEEIAARRGNFIELILREVVRALTGTFFPGLTGAFDQLVDWVQNILPGWIMQPISDLINLLIDILDLIPIFGPPAGDALEYFANIFGLLRDNTEVAQGTGENAQSSADNANVGVAKLAAQVASGAVSGGIVINDTFDRTGGNLGTNWTQTYSGSGAGSLTTDGNNAHWVTNGSDARHCFCRYSAQPLSTDIQAAALVATQALDNIATPPVLRLVLRCNAASTAYVIAIITRTTAEIGYVVGSSYTRLGSQVAINTTPGDLWLFKAGTDTPISGLYEFVLFQNGTEVLRRTDTGGTSLVGASNRYTGMQISSGQHFAGFVFIEVAAPDIQYFTAYDRLTTA